jgi:hypothetical protein
MTILGTLLKAIFSHPAASTSDPGAPAPPPGADAPAAPPAAPDAPAPEASSPASRPSVDIAPVLDALVAERGEPLDWQHSVVDLLKAVGLDSSYQARVRMARELHYDGPKNSEAMNEWLHDAVLKAIADNGGKLPAGL